MYYFISNIAYFFISPENWIIVLTLLVFLFKKPKVKKRLVIAIFLLIILCGNRYVFTTLANAWQPKIARLPAAAVYEAGILLGGAVSFDKHGNGYFNSPADRFIEASILYKTGKVKRIIISGGSNATGQPRDADFQYSKMLALGIPQTDLFVEDSSTNTYENAAFTKIIIDSLQLKPPYVLVTSAMHIPRAKRVFAKAGLSVIPFPSDYHVIESDLKFADYLIPNVGTLLGWSNFLKEVVGTIGYKMFDKA